MARQCELGTDGSWGHRQPPAPAGTRGCEGRWGAMEPSGCSVCLSKGASQQEPQRIRGNTLLLQLRGTPCPRAARCSGGKSLPGAPAATTSCPQLSQLIFFFPFSFCLPGRGFAVAMTCCYSAQIQAEFSTPVEKSVQQGKCLFPF